MNLTYEEMMIGLLGLGITEDDINGVNLKDTADTCNSDDLSE